MDVLIKRTESRFDVVNHSEINIGETFVYGKTVNNLPQKRVVTNVLEHRKERGVYKDESNRRWWASIESEKLTVQVND